MAKGPQYHVPFRRRREGKTDYYLRRRLLVSRKNRFVVRKTPRHLTVQIITHLPVGDKTLIHVHTSELVNKYGWKASTGNLSAAYLVGYLAGKKALASNINEAILDIGLNPPVKGSRVFAALKGAVDAGLVIPHKKEILPDDERIKGYHIVKFYESLTQGKLSFNKQQFNALKSGDLSISILPEHFEETLKKIDSEFSKKPSAKKTTKSKPKSKRS
ncbi:MAG: 50S ribosomal protein L18 [Candidatus Odinarchaeia archaeon]